MPDWKQRMEWDLAFARKSARTQKIYLADAKAFAAFQGRSPEELGQKEVRVWVEHLVERKVSPSRLRQHLAALVFLFRKTLGMPQAVSFFSWPNDPEPLPVVLSPAEVARLLQHVLPQGFHKVRHGGLYASTRKGGRLDQARALLEQEVDPEEAAKWQRGTAETMAKLVFEGHPCPDCGGIMERTNVRIPGLRAPPGGCDA